MGKQSMENWGEYLRAKEPSMREKAYAWKTAIGLQKVDGLTPSDFLVDTARRNIEGEITLVESRELIEGYHRVKKRAVRNALVRANYSNIPKGIEETLQYLEKFFRNLLLGEQNSLQSRYLIIDGWQGGDDDPTSNPTSKVVGNVRFGLQLSAQVWRLIRIINGEMTRLSIMKALKLKDRVTFTKSFLGPALKIGLVEMTQPESPRSPTQRYRLTELGIRTICEIRD